MNHAEEIRACEDEPGMTSSGAGVSWHRPCQECQECTQHRDAAPSSEQGRSEESGVEISTVVSRA